MLEQTFIFKEHDRDRARAPTFLVAPRCDVTFYLTETDQEEGTKKADVPNEEDEVDTEESEDSEEVRPSVIMGVLYRAHKWCFSLHWLKQPCELLGWPIFQ